MTKKSPLKETDSVTKRSDQESTQEINNKNNTKYNNHNGHDYIVTLNENKFPEIVTEIISDFFSLYKIYKGKEHPKLKPEQRKKIYEQIGNFIDEHEYIDSYMSDMIDKYFNTKFNMLKCDYNINHFSTEEILTNLMYEIRGY